MCYCWGITFSVMSDGCFHSEVHCGKPLISTADSNQILLISCTSFKEIVSSANPHVLRMQESVFEILGHGVKEKRDPQNDRTQESKSQNGPQTFSMVLPGGGTRP